MSIDTIEDKLYQSNFKSEQVRLQTYLAVHATLTRNKEVPRIYIRNIDYNFESIRLLLKEIIFNDINHVVEDTNKHLAILGVSTKALTSLSHDEKNEIISSLEDLLLNGWGSGKVHYEYPRIYPVESCELLNWILKLNINDDRLFSLIDILKKRQGDLLNFRNEQDKVFSPGYRRFHPTILSKSYQLLIEKQWKNNWAHHSNYDDLNHDSIPSLVIAEDL